ncbi:hypothetical protein [Brevibacillus fulvus]|uniref:SPOR domain-containing protein n=1 Tax=Brevibacillus fulvus TaxID=1125967 RepID=A0A939BU11_9BACL|nr:hypothetical protein [Brevibacillus fulvus]MBM7590029.1 hypothetical protein [Brevibacillus fulvus]
MADKRNSQISVKLNGQQMELKNTPPVAVPAPVVTTPIVRKEETETPSPGEIGKSEKDAWERLLEVRTDGNRMTVSPVNAKTETDPNDFHEEIDDVADKWHYRKWYLSKNPLLQTTLTLFSAIAIGLIFGFFVLTAFLQEQFSSTYRNVLDGTFQSLTTFTTGLELPGENASVPDEPQQTETEPMSPPAQTQLRIKVAEQTLMMAQFGVFATAEAAQTAITQLEQQGLPHMLVEQEGKQYLYVAVAPKRDDLLGLASYLKNKGMEVYIKELTIPEVERPNVTVTASASQESAGGLQNMFATGLSLVGDLSYWSGKIGNDPNAQKITAEEMNHLKEQHRQFLEQSRSGQFPQEWEPYVNGMITGLNQAMAAQEKMSAALADNKPSQAESYAWQVQGGVLAYLQNYLSWSKLS